MNKPILTVMVGLSGSGRNDVARNLAYETHAVLVSYAQTYNEVLGLQGDPDRKQADEIVWTEFLKKVRMLLEKKKNVIVDAPFTTMSERRKILQRIKGLDIIKLCYIVPCTYKICQNVIRENPWVPDDELKKQLYKFEIPFMEEGWDEIYLCSTYPSEIPDWEAFQQFDQKNPHHSLSLQGHSQVASNLFEAMNMDTPWLQGALLHDYGKMFTQTIGADGVAHYYSHQNVGAYHVLCMYPIVHFLNTVFLVNYHMLPFDWDRSEKAKEKWRRRFGDEKFEILLKFHSCDLEAR